MRHRATLEGRDSNLNLKPQPIHPKPCTLQLTPYTLHPAPYTLHPAPYTLHPTPYTLHPTPVISWRRSERGVSETARKGELCCGYRGGLVFEAHRLSYHST